MPTSPGDELRGRTGTRGAEARNRLRELRTFVKDRPPHAALLETLIAIGEREKDPETRYIQWEDTDLPNGVSFAIGEALVDDLNWIYDERDYAAEGVYTGGYPGAYRARRITGANAQRQRRQTMDSVEHTVRGGVL